MGSIVVCGGGVVGLCAAMMLARDGHDVTVLESDRDPAPAVPLDAWSAWTRKGVGQFNQPHNLFARFHRICEDELPGLNGRMLAAGCVWVDYLEALPPGITDRAPRAGDERFRFVTGRRPVFEAVVAGAAEEQPGVTVRRGVRVTGLVPGPRSADRTPHVAGVRTDSGEELKADLVVDAMGRRSVSPKWFAELGAPEPATEAEDCGFVYYTRYFGGPVRPRRIGSSLTPIGTISVLTLDGDNDTWSVTVFCATGDPPLKNLRHNECFGRVIDACPLQAHWLDGQPLTDVLPMAGVLDRYRRFAVDGRPIVTGFAAVGDAWACTNPSAGRGLSVGLIHAQLLRHTIRDALEDPAAFARLWDERTEEIVTPFYRNQIAADRARIGEMNALRSGVEPPRNESVGTRLAAASAYDPDLFRAVMEIIQCLALPQEVLARPGLREKIDQYADVESTPAPGPDRPQLLELLGA